jgi:hypothetical protein
MRLLPTIISPALILCLLPTVTWADTVTLVSSRDTTIYQGNPQNSNGSGQAMFAGTTGLGFACRALVGFDVAGNIPAGSTITNVQLSLVLALAAPGQSLASQIELHPLLADWGEGTVGQGTATAGSGQGFPTPADGTSATWLYGFYNTVPWGNPGGDFVATASGSTMVGASPNVTYTWNSTSAMVNDAQSWLDNPASNFGWLLLGDESTASTARVFFTREAPNSAVTPSLVVTYTPPSPAAAQLVVSTPSSATAGSPFDVTVTALDSDGNVVTGYSGTVTFRSADPYPAVLPADYTFTSSDQGTHTFSSGVTFFTAGAQTLTAQDTADSSLTGSATIGVAAAPTSQLRILAAATAIPGTPFDVTVAALDPYGNVDLSYAGTVTWTSSDTDPAVLLPADYMYQATDNGIVTFPAGVTLVTLGNQTLTATDTVTGITGSTTVTVGPGP